MVWGEAGGEAGVEVGEEVGEEEVGVVVDILMRRIFPTPTISLITLK